MSAQNVERKHNNPGREKASNFSGGNRLLSGDLELGSNDVELAPDTQYRAFEALPC
jgi:hypothetical protein